MEVIIYLTALVLGYKLVMPFVGWIVGPKGMDITANYIERTERRFPTKELFKWFIEWKNKRRNKKEP